MNSSEALLTESQLAQLIIRAVPTVQKDRLRGTGPHYIKIGRLVRYRPEDVRAWLAERVRRSTSEVVAKAGRGDSP
jgi:predicted DNA-binding transcriptional regulator AlpA